MLQTAMCSRPKAFIAAALLVQKVHHAFQQAIVYSPHILLWGW